MDRRNLLQASILLAIHGPLVPCARPSERKPISAYEIAPTIHVLDLTVGGCAELESRLSIIVSEKERLRLNWNSVANEYRLRAQARMAEVRQTIASAEKKASDLQRRKYIQTTIMAVGIAVSAIGIAIGTPIAIGAAVGVNLMLAPVEMMLQVVFDADGDEFSLATISVGNRAFMIGTSSSEKLAGPVARILAPTVKALELAVGAWQLQSTAKEQNLALKQASAAREALGNLERRVRVLEVQPRQWAILYTSHLIQTEVALRKFIDATRNSDCRIPVGPRVQVP